LADVIYAYCDEYKIQGIREGLNPNNIVVVGNPIVDILNHYYYDQIDKFQRMATAAFFGERQLAQHHYYIMTCHRRENVNVESSLRAIMTMISQAPCPVYFPASYRTQKVIRELRLSLPSNVLMVDPIGYEEMLCLMVNSRGVITDSGTVVEEACILQLPSIQMRRSTERPQVYDVGSSVKFDPAEAHNYPPEQVLAKLESLFGKKWKHTLGDGRSSERIADDLRRRIAEGDFSRHKPADYSIPVERSYRGDGL
jgi:UDP-N-acetylglucosamine 2-epimerase (non-hydrolysing)